MALRKGKKDSELKRIHRVPHLCFLSPNAIRSFLQILPLPPNLLKKQNSSELEDLIGFTK